MPRFGQLGQVLYPKSIQLDPNWCDHVSGRNEAANATRSNTKLQHWAKTNSITSHADCKQLEIQATLEKQQDRFIHVERTRQIIWKWMISMYCDPDKDYLNRVARLRCSCLASTARPALSILTLPDHMYVNISEQSNNRTWLKNRRRENHLDFHGVNLVTSQMVYLHVHHGSWVLMMHGYQRCILSVHGASWILLVHHE